MNQPKRFPLAFLPTPLEYVKKLSEFLKLDLTFDGKIFKLEDKNILQKNIEENLLEKIVIFR